MRSKLKTIVYGALYCALFVVLDYLSNALNLFRMPQGGSLSLASVALLLASYHLGYREGLLCAFVTVLLQFVIGSVHFYGILSLILDYLLGYLAYGLSSLFPNYKKLYFGIIITNGIRLALSTLSGMIVWQTPFWASLLYNGEYLLPTLIVDLLLVPLLHGALLKTEH